MDVVEMIPKEMWETSGVTFFSVSECASIIQEAQRTYRNGKRVYNYGLVIQLILQTGIRLGEAVGLKKCDYDRELKVLKIRRSVCRSKNRDANGNALPGTTLVVTGPKSKAGKCEIPLTDQAVKIIEALCAEFPDSEWMVNSSKGIRARPEQIDRSFATVLENIDIPRAGVHKLRHTFARLLFQGGTDVKSVSRLLGHANATITLGVYIHIADQLLHTVVVPISDLGVNP